MGRPGPAAAADLVPGPRRAPPVPSARRHCRARARCGCGSARSRPAASRRPGAGRARYDAAGREVGPPPRRRHGWRTAHATESPRSLGGRPARHRTRAHRRRSRRLHLPGVRRPPRRRATPPGPSLGPARRWLAPRGARRLRGLPAPLGRRDLPVQPDRRRHPGRRPGGARTVRLAWMAGAARAPRRTIPFALYDRQRDESLELVAAASISGPTDDRPPRRPRTRMSTVTTPLTTDRRPRTTSGTLAPGRSTLWRRRRSPVPRSTTLDGPRPRHRRGRRRPCRMADAADVEAADRRRRTRRS